MGSTSCVQDEDRISNLPDTVIGHILSFLPRKDAVATSVLSTKWKDSWTFTTRLEFVDELLRPHLQSGFMNFVERELLRERPNKVYFECRGYYDVSRVNEWIASVLKRDNMQELHLTIRVRLDARLPGDLFRKETLVKLKLDIECVMDIAQSVWLPRLKVLKIQYARFLDGDSLTNLLCGCPLLENLSLGSCFDEDIHVINIRAPVLTRLKLASLVRWDPCSSFFGIKLVLETPMLTDLVIYDLLYEYYEFNNLNHLKQGIISMDCSWPDGEDEFPLSYNHSKAVEDILEAVSRVQTLDLSRCSMEVIDRYQSRLPVFQHLTKLTLSSSPCYYWNMLPLYLEKSPHLRTLTFTDGLEFQGNQETCRCCDLNHFSPPDAVPICLHYHLKIIELGKFYGFDEGVQIMKYFLENSRVLEKLVVYPYSLSVYKKLDVIIKELVMLPRPSDCQIVFPKSIYET